MRQIFLFDGINPLPHPQLSPGREQKTSLAQRLRQKSEAATATFTGVSNNEQARNIAWGAAGNLSKGSKSRLRAWQEKMDKTAEKSIAARFLADVAEEKPLNLNDISRIFVSVATRREMDATDDMRLNWTTMTSGDYEQLARMIMAHAHKGYAKTLPVTLDMGHNNIVTLSPKKKSPPTEPWQMKFDDFVKLVSSMAPKFGGWAAGINSRDGNTEYTMPPNYASFEIGGVKYSWSIWQGSHKRGTSMAFTNPKLGVSAGGRPLSSHTFGNVLGGEAQAVRSALRSILKDQVMRHQSETAAKC